jgi:hypothetical protein
MGNNYGLDRIFIVLGALNVAQLVLEVAYFKCYRNKGIKLQMKLKTRLTQRLWSYFCTTLLTFALGGILAVVVMKAKYKYSCPAGYFA